MKITKRQLQQIIKEEISDILDVDHPSDVEAVEGVWSGDIGGEAKNLSLDIDHPKAAGAEETTKEPEMLPRQEDLVGESKNLRLTKRQLIRIISEEIATVNKETIEDTVLSVLSDEGGAAGLEPIEDALEELEDEDISLPDEPIEDVVADVTGVKRHADGDFVDTTQLESRSMKITKKQLLRIIAEEKQKLLSEANPDGTISPNEDLERKDFLDDVSAEINDLLEDIRKRAAEIGGPFRAPGIRAQAKEILVSAVRSFR